MKISTVRYEGTGLHFDVKGEELREILSGSQHSDRFELIMHLLTKKQLTETVIAYSILYDRLVKRIAELPAADKSAESKPDGTYVVTVDVKENLETSPEMEAEREANLGEIDRLTEYSKALASTIELRNAEEKRLLEDLNYQKSLADKLLKVIDRL